MARYREPSKNRGSQFGATEGFRNGGKHGGADWTTWNGRAITSGTIAAVYWSDVIGNVVIQTTQDDKFVLYAHLAQPSKLKVGAKVIIGITKIGKMGSTGTASTGPHVHIAISKKSNPSLAAFADLIDPVQHIKEQNAKR